MKEKVKQLIARFFTRRAQQPEQPIPWVGTPVRIQSGQWAGEWGAWVDIPIETKGLPNPGDPLVVYTAGGSLIRKRIKDVIWKNLDHHVILVATYSQMDDIIASWEAWHLENPDDYGGDLDFF